MKKSAEGWANLVKTIDSFEEKLAEKSTYIVGDQIALAECAIFTIFPYPHF